MRVAATPPNRSATQYGPFPQDGRLRRRAAPVDPSASAHVARRPSRAGTDCGRRELARLYLPIDRQHSELRACISDARKQSASVRLVALRYKHDNLAAVQEGEVVLVRSIFRRAHDAARIERAGVIPIARDD